jgi:hypothetical protein
LLQRDQDKERIGHNTTCAMEPRMALLSVDTLKQLCLKENKYTFKEFRVLWRAESLKDFVDLCFLDENGEYDKKRIAWVTENAFVPSRYDFDLPSGCHHYRQFDLKFWATDDDVCSHEQYLHIYSSTTEEAIAALDLLAGLRDSYFKGSTFTRMMAEVDKFQSAHWGVVN